MKLLPLAEEEVLVGEVRPQREGLDAVHDVPSHVVRVLGPGHLPPEGVADVDGVIDQIVHFDFRRFEISTDQTKYFTTKIQRSCVRVTDP